MKKQVLLTSLLAFSCAHATSATWNVPSSGSWNSDTNWTAPFPNGVGETAAFGDVGAATTTISLENSVTVGSISFTNSSDKTFTINGTSPCLINLDSASLASITTSNSGANTLAAPLKLTKNLSINLSETAPLLISGPISGVQGLTKTGDGTLFLQPSTPNTYRGATTVNNGTISYASDGAIPTDSLVKIGANGFLNFSISTSEKNAFAIADIAGQITQNSGSTVILKSLNGASANGLVTLATSGSQSFQITGGEFSTYSGVISGGSASNSADLSGNYFLVRGGSTLTLNGPNSNASFQPLYVGRTFVTDNSTIVIQKSSALGLGAGYAYSGGCFVFDSTTPMSLSNDFFINGNGPKKNGVIHNQSGHHTLKGKINLGSTTSSFKPAPVLINIYGGSSLTLQGTISGDQNLNKLGAGTLILQPPSANTYTGATYLNNGPVTYATNGAIPPSSKTFLDGTNLLISANMTDDSALDLNLISNGTITQGDGVAVRLKAISGGGFINLSAAGPTFDIIGPGNFNLSTTISGRTYTVSPPILPNAGNCLFVRGNTNLTLSGPTFYVVFGVDKPASVTMNGRLMGRQNLIKIGDGTLTLQATSPNTYLGSTEINAGTLNYASDGAIPSNSPISIAPDATLLLSVNMTDPNAMNLTDLSGRLLQGPNSTVKLKTLLGTGMVQLDGSKDAKPFSIIGIGKPCKITYDGTITGGIASSSFNISGELEITLPKASNYLSPTYLTGNSTLILSNESAIGADLYIDSGSALKFGAEKLNAPNPLFLNGTRAIDSNVVTAELSGPMRLGFGPAPLDVTINVESEGTLTLSNAISGSQNLIKTGSGTLIYTGSSDNTYGTTTVACGTLKMAKNPGKNAIPGNLLIKSGGRVENGADDQIIDSATITIDGGTYDMHGFNETFANALIFNSGSLIQNAPALLKKRLTLNGPPSTINLSGNGTVLQMSGGTSIPSVGSGVGVTITSGADGGNIEFLAQNDAPSTISAINLGNFIRLITVENSSADYDLTIGGSYITPVINRDSPGFVKLGAGTLQLTGSHAYTADEGGSTLIQEGAVAVNGDFSGNIGVITAGILQGSGSVKGDIYVTDGGTIAPGNGIGTLTVTGDLSFKKGGNFNADLSPDKRDLLQVNGAVTIEQGSTLNLLPTPAVYPGEFQYVLINATEGVTGKFTVFNVPASDSATFKSTLQYGSLQNGLYSTATLGNSGTCVFLTNIVGSFGSILTSGNNGAIASYWDCASLAAPPADIAQLFSDMHTASADQLASAADQSSPVAIKALALSQENNSFNIRSKISNRAHAASLKHCRKEQRDGIGASIWADIGYDRASQNSEQELPGFNNKTGNALLGFDYENGNNFIFGAALGYSHSDVRFNDAKGRGTIDSGYVSLYGHGYSGYAFIDLNLMGAISRYGQQRTINFMAGTVPYNISPEAHFDGSELLGHMALGLIQSWNRFEARPFIAFDYLGMNQKSFKESGGGALDLFIDKSFYSIIRSEAGLDFSFCAPSRSFRATVEGKLSYIREQRISGKYYTGRLHDTACCFKVEGLSPNRNLIAPSLGFSFHSLDDNQSLSFRYNGEFGHHYSDNGLTLSFILKF